MNIIYTAIIGESDNPAPVPRSAYPCFLISDSDQTLAKAEAEGWVPVKWSHDWIKEIGARKAARFLKIDIAALVGVIPHCKDRAIRRSIWIDGSITANKNGRSLDDLFMLVCEDVPVAMHKHAFVSDLAGEICAVVEGQKDQLKGLLPQAEKYWRAGMQQTTHFETSCIVRYHAPECLGLCARWWEEVRHGSPRDQISLPWAIFASKVKIHPLAGTVYENDYFSIRWHLRS